MIKRLTMWHVRAGVRRDEAVHHWPSGHVPFVVAVPGAQRYVQSRCVQEPAGGDPPYAGLGEVWFESMEVAVSSQATPQWQAVIEDAATFMDLDRLTIAWAEEYTAT